MVDHDVETGDDRGVGLSKVRSGVHFRPVWVGSEELGCLDYFEIDVGRRDAPSIVSLYDGVDSGLRDIGYDEGRKSPARMAEVE